LAEYHNPQQEPGTDRRMLLAVGIMLVLIMLSQPLLKKFLPSPPEPPAPTQTASKPGATNPPVAPPSASSAPASIAAKQARAEAETVVENDLYRITFSNRGAQVKSWVLKKYDDDHGKPLELVSAAAAKYGQPLSLWMYDENLRNKINSALYVSSFDQSILMGEARVRMTVSAQQPGLVGTNHLTAPTVITFEFADADVSVRKTFRFDNTYVLHVEATVLYKGSQVTALPMWPAGFGDQNWSGAYGSSQIEYQNNSDVTRLAVKKISGGGTLPGPFNWAGVTDQYFAAVFIPEEAQDAALVTLRNQSDAPARDPKKTNDRVPVQVLGAAAGSLHGPTSLRMYVGPKSLDALEPVAIPTIIGAPQDLRALVNFGFFNLIARPLFQWLKWTHAHITSNWGWAIVIQTLIINLALLPLRIYQMRSALKMQKIQPQMKAIQEKYKKYSMRDPRKQDMQKELWELQQKEGVNMFSGCLPMIIQLPFLFAYYSMLNASIDLRHATWAWIPDLSSPDPWYLLPIGMVISMIVMQRMMPTPGMDPAQAKMMNLMMPLMMGYIFFRLAAGLNLYYAESNLVSVTQQLIMNRTRLGQEMRALAAKRARKKDK
jgi:YidC/Oxa1 family membrane protein insertase